jgi:hypothetical protein
MAYMFPQGRVYIPDQHFHGKATDGKMGARRTTETLNTRQSFSAFFVPPLNMKNV